MALIMTYGADEKGKTMLTDTAVNESRKNLIFRHV